MNKINFMAHPPVYKSLLGFSAAILASGFLFLAISSQAAPAGAPVITGDIIVNPPAPQARQEVTLSLSAGGASDDKTAAKDLIYFWDFGEEYESALGNSASSPNLGEIKHFFDEARVYNASLRVIDADGNVSDPKTFLVTADPIAPKNDSRTQWPKAHITRPGNGPYAVGAVKFSGTLSQPGGTGQIVPGAGFEWHLFDEKNAELTVAGTGPNAVIGRTGNEFTYTFSSPGYYYVTLKANQINPVFFDNAIYAFEVTNNASRVANQEFSVAIASSAGSSVTVTSVDYISESSTFTAKVTGGLPSFVWTWHYAPSTNEFSEYTVENMSQSNETPKIVFTSPGTKTIHLKVRDTAWREMLATFDFQIIDKVYTGTSYSPPIPDSFSSQPLSLGLTPLNTDLQFTALAPTTLNGPIPPRVVNFQAVATGGLPQYSYSWSATNRQGVCQATTCSYSFDKLGNYTIALGVTDHSSPAQVTSQSRNIVISAVSTSGPSGGTTGGTTGGGTSGGTSGGSTGGTTGGGTSGGGAAGTIVDPSGTNYGLNSSFKDVTIGQSTDPKATAAKIINIILGFLGIIAVILGLWGGFQIMTAAGNEDKVASGRKTMTYAVIGLVIIFVAWGIAQFVITNLLSATT